MRLDRTSPSWQSLSTHGPPDCRYLDCGIRPYNQTPSILVVVAPFPSRTLSTWPCHNDVQDIQNFRGRGCVLKKCRISVLGRAGRDHWHNAVQWHSRSNARKMSSGIFRYLLRNQESGPRCQSSIVCGPNRRLWIWSVVNLLENVKLEAGPFNPYDTAKAVIVAYKSRSGSQNEMNS